MKIAIIGTRGIPNYYGGFEQFAEYLSVGLIKKGHDVTVYNSHFHPYKQSEWNGVKIVHCYDPEEKIGTAGQFIYDFNCILDSRKRGFDAILQLGYTSSSIWGKLLPKDAMVFTNMDGLEWKRTKFSPKVQKFLLKAERWAVKMSDYLISDSLGIKDYLHNKYKIDSTYIPYGAHLFHDPHISKLAKYDVKPYNFNMLIARLEPENSIEVILDGVSDATDKKTFLIIGNHKTKYGEYLKAKYKEVSNINFFGGLYDIEALNNLRYYSNIYFHGHTVGGTNPSLLEAMASSALICAHNNPFNRYILGEDSLYFTTREDVAEILNSTSKESSSTGLMVNHNRIKIEKYYSWQKIIDSYEELFLSKLNTLQAFKHKSVL
ncbi:DUF1972 domain-containing protein [Pontibacter mangrovi]|uniref:Glycosyltransferase family 1 protein n=1 Tax=Pontibacter mangrovi TaxID=2589816 RepID=A0A501WG44_9BACT|nr:DUF1972 domain-containing protein [Pontibacter mangrovi]TPE46131.1 glycosyltransferase family 1 protein [Pontibacter mangrovi]